MHVCVCDIHEYYCPTTYGWVVASHFWSDIAVIAIIHRGYSMLSIATAIYWHCTYKNFISLHWFDGYYVTARLINLVTAWIYWCRIYSITTLFKLNRFYLQFKSIEHTVDAAYCRQSCAGCRSPIGATPRLRHDTLSADFVVWYLGSPPLTVARPIYAQ